jgi:predicted Zn-ribbon and HTH transcriptional regulator
MDLNLKNLSSQQVISILSELANPTAVAAIVQMRMKNREMTDQQIIQQLTQAATKYLA